MVWTIVRDDREYERALALARGSYQRGLLCGVESLSGSTLKGLARKYSAKYRTSRDNLLRRMTAHGVVWSEDTIRRRRVLIIGE